VLAAIRLPGSHLVATGGGAKGSYEEGPVLCGIWWRGWWCGCGRDNDDRFCINIEWSNIIIVYLMMEHFADSIHCLAVVMTMFKKHLHATIPAIYCLFFTHHRMYIIY